MSYCRFGSPDSGAYIYASVRGGIVCCACRLLPKIKYPSGEAWYQVLGWVVSRGMVLIGSGPQR